MSFSCLLWLDNRETTFFFETCFRDHLFKFRNGHRRRARPPLVLCVNTNHCMPRGRVNERCGLEPVFRVFLPKANVEFGV